MKPISLKPQEREILSRAFRGAVPLKGSLLRHGRSLAARGYGALDGARFALLEPGRALWVSVRDQRSPRSRSNQQAVVASKPDTWGPLSGEQQRKRRTRGPVATLLAKGLIDEQEASAAVQIARAFQILTSGTGYRSLVLQERVDQSSGGWSESMEDFSDRLQRRYTQFMETCRDCGTDRSAMIDLIVFDQSFRVTDRLYRKASGWSQTSLVAVLKDFSGYLEKRVKTHK